MAATIAEVWKSGQSRVYKLSNGQYWEEHFATTKGASVGAKVRIAPSPFFYNMDAGAQSATDLIGVMQLPLIADTTVTGPFSGMESDGIYALMGAGYWRVFQDSMSSETRVLLTSPNNLDYWIYTASVAEGKVDPAKVFADGDVTAAAETGFTLDDGTRWGYVISMPFDPVTVGVRAVVFNIAFYDDRRDDNKAAPYCWHQGGASFGEWVEPISRTML